MRKRKSKQHTIDKGFEAAAEAPKVQPLYRISSQRSIESASIPLYSSLTAESGPPGVALSPIAPQDLPASSPPLEHVETLQPPGSPSSQVGSPGSHHQLVSTAAPSEATTPTTPIPNSPGPQPTAVIAPTATGPPADPKREGGASARPRPRREPPRPRSDQMQETDAGRIVAIAPPRYDPAWRDE